MSATTHDTTGGTPPTVQQADTLVVVPTYNERNNLDDLVIRLFNHNPDVHLLIVDDNSPDGTGRHADHLATLEDVDWEGRLHVLHRTTKDGLGGAYRLGLRWGIDQGYTWLAQMDADLSHDPADLTRMRQAAGTCDLIIGSRYVPGGACVNWPKHRLLLSRAGNLYTRLLLRLGVNDATAGFRLWHHTALRTIGIATTKCDGYAFQVETTRRARHADLRIKEVPITFTERTIGTSKIGRNIIIEAIWQIAKWAAADLRH